MPGIKLREKQLKFLEKLTFSDELINLEWDKPKNDNYDFYLGNGVFESGDAEFYTKSLDILNQIKSLKLVPVFPQELHLKLLK